MNQSKPVDMGWKFDNSYARLPKVFYTSLPPTPVPSPRLIILNDSLAKELGLGVRGLTSS